MILCWCRQTVNVSITFLIWNFPSACVLCNTCYSVTLHCYKSDLNEYAKFARTAHLHLASTSSREDFNKTIMLESFVSIQQQALWKQMCLYKVK